MIGVFDSGHGGLTMLTGLAGAIEAGASEDEFTAVVEDYLEGLPSQIDGARLDHAVLGCTHFSLIAPLFTRILSPGTGTVSQPEPVAEGHCRFLTTGDPATVSRIASRFLGRALGLEAA